ncbi:MAG: hypothetical protein Fur0041_13650 [Bacteroidia bacterium]
MPLVLFLLCFIVFGNTLFNNYALDDEFYTAGANKLTQKGISGIPEIFTTRTFYNNDGSGYSYRPVAAASFALEIAAFGENPHVSHFINVLIYAVTILLLFAVLKRWFVNQGEWFAFFVTLLFLVHPLHTEVVGNIKCRDELLAFGFVVATLYFIHRYFETGKFYFLIIYPLLFWAGELSKSSVVPMLFFIPVCLWFFTDKSIVKILITVAPLFATAGLTLLIMKTVLPDMSRTLQTFENPITQSMSILERLPIGFHVLARYAYLFVIPHPLVYYYGLEYVPVATWSDPYTIAGILLYGFLAYVMLKNFRSKSVLAFGLFFYMGNIALYSNILHPAPGLMGERFAYVASLGACVAAVWLIFHLLKTDLRSFSWNEKTTTKARNIFIALIALYSIRSIVRNEAWENKETLYRNDIEYAGNSAKQNMLLGSLLSSMGAEANFEARGLAQQGNSMMAGQRKEESKKLFFEAREYYKTATAISESYHTAWSNLGTTYYFVGDYRNGIPFFKKSISINPKYTEAYFNLGMSYDQLKLKDSSVFYFRQAIRTDSTYTPAYEQLGRVLISNDSNYTAAIQLYLTAARKKPDAESPWNSIASAYMSMGDTAKAAEATEKAASINPKNIQRLYNLAEYYRSHGNNEKYNYYSALFSEQQRLAAKENKKKKKQR